MGDSIRRYCEVLGISRGDSLRLHIHLRYLTLAADEAIRLVQRLPFVTHVGHVTKLDMLVVAYRGCTIMQMEENLVRCLWKYCKPPF